MIGLGQVVANPQGAQIAFVIVENRCATNHHPLLRVALPDPAADLDTREHRQVEVDQSEVERSGIDEAVDPLGPVTSLDDGKSLTSEELGDQSPEGLLVLDEK